MINTHYPSSSEYETESEDDAEVEKIKLVENINYILIYSLDRDWKNLSKNIFL